jgi:hypothetical protein
MNILASVKNKIVTLVTPASIVCGNSDYTITFTFDDEWSAEAIKTARFVYRRGGENKWEDVVFNGNTVKVPVLRDITMVLVGVYAGELRTTMPAVINCEKSILCGGGSHDAPPEDVYNQILAAVNELIGLTGNHPNMKNNPHGVTCSQVGAFPVVVRVTTQNTNLDDYKTPGIYFFTSNFIPNGIPGGKNGWLVVLPNSATDSDFVKQLWLRAGTAGSNDHMTYVRTFVDTTWGGWNRFVTAAELLSIEADVAAMKEKPFCIISADNVNFYVDGNAGSDDNPGTKSKPFKTFNRFCEELYKKAEIRCYFIGDCAEYEMTNVETFNAIAIHLVNDSTVDNITIHFKGVYTPSFYNCHLNVGATDVKDSAGNVVSRKCFTLDIPNDLYFDGGAHVLEYAKVTNGSLSVHGGNLQTNYCEFINANLRGTGAKLHVRGCKFTYNGDHLIAADSGSTLYVMSSFTASGTIAETGTNNYYGAICGTGARIVLGCVLVNDNLVGRILHLQDSQVQCNDVRFATWNTESKFSNSVRFGETYNFLNG